MKHKKRLSLTKQTRGSLSNVSTKMTIAGVRTRDTLFVIAKGVGGEKSTSGGNGRQIVKWATAQLWAAMGIGLVDYN